MKKRVNKSEQIIVRLTPDEAFLIKQKAQSFGLTISEYVRSVAVHKRGRPSGKDERPRVKFRIKSVRRKIEPVTKAV
jgi:hypothetical protein